MTKLRLQHQQGRSSPTFTGRPSSSNGLGGSLGGSLGSSLGSGSGGVGGVGVGHERGEWRRSGSAGSAAMMEDYHRSVAEDGPSGPASFRRTNSLMTAHVQHPGLQRESSMSAMSARRAFNGGGGGGGRIEGSSPLEDRMRGLPSAMSDGGGGSGGLHTLSLRLNGGDDVDEGFWPRSSSGGGGGNSGFASAPPGGSSMPMGFPSGAGSASGSGTGSLHEASGGSRGRGVIGRGGSVGNLASVHMDGMDNVPSSHSLSHSLTSRPSRFLESAYDDSARRGGGGGGGGGGLGSNPSSMSQTSSRFLSSAGRSGSVSLSPPGGGGVGGGGGGGGMGLGLGGGGGSGSGVDTIRDRSDLFNARAAVGGRRSSYDGRKAPHWSTVSQSQNVPGRGDAHAGGDSSRAAIGRPAELRISRSNFDLQHYPSGSVGGGNGGATSNGVGGGAAGAWGVPARGSSAPGGGGGAIASTEDMTAMMCAEFALLTPKSANEKKQQQQQKLLLQQQAQQQQQQQSGMLPMKMWSPRWAMQVGGFDAPAGAQQARSEGAPVGGGGSSSLGGGEGVGGIGGGRLVRGGSTNGGSVGSGVAVGSQVRKIIRLCVF
eukprot:jgi/Undpi1/2052/HiC_scaffold_12.g05438.m1